MMRSPKKLCLILLAAASLLFQGFTFINNSLPDLGEGPGSNYAFNDLPVTQPYLDEYLLDVAQADIRASNTIPLRQFAQSLVDGNANLIRGLFVEEKFAFPVIQQPSGNAGYVSTTDDVITEFAMARNYGVTGLMAHNYLAGANFYSIEIGDIIQVIYGDGGIMSYQVREIQSYQALSPHSTTSKFIDLQTSETLTASQLFKRVYMGSHHLTLLTCIQQGTEDSWGRMFIIADPI